LGENSGGLKRLWDAQSYGDALRMRHDKMNREKQVGNAGNFEAFARPRLGGEIEGGIIGKKSAARREIGGGSPGKDDIRALQKTSKDKGRSPPAAEYKNTGALGCSRVGRACETRASDAGARGVVGIQKNQSSPLHEGNGDIRNGKRKKGQLR